MRYFATSPQAVEDAMAETAIADHALVHALIERGHSTDEIAKMRPRDRLDEFLQWEGIRGWTDTIIRTAKASGFVVGESRPPRPADDEISKLLDGIYGAVEADSFAKHHLWQNWSEEAQRFGYGGDHVRYPWKDRASGVLEHIGNVGDHPVWLSLMVDTVNERHILFYYATSRVVDHEMVRCWLDLNLPQSARSSDGRIRNTDANNFHIIVH